MSGPQDVRSAVVSDLHAAGIMVGVGARVLFTLPTQLDEAVGIYQSHGLLPPDLTTG